jgi:rfaE bifunctional protein nucleotidyltransferase chain/domain
VTLRAPASKVLSVETLLEKHGRPREHSVVFTNGVFDLMHRGHTTYLAAARALGDVLVVGVNSDASARRQGKGPGRPIIEEFDRVELLAALEAVDVVCLFDDDTPSTLVEALLPDVLVKGGDYSLDEVIGRTAVEGAGGRVDLIGFVDGYSSGDLIQRIRETD